MGPTGKKQVIAIQQPEHLPWIGFFNKMNAVDEFIYLDNVQFKKRYFENRNKIKIKDTQDSDWIVIPVKTKGAYTQKINQVEIDYTQKWQRKYLNKIRVNYIKAPFFDEIFNNIEAIINSDYKKLIDLNLALIDFVRSYLDIATPVVRASSICEGRGSDLILDLCLRNQADTYLSGPDGKIYLKLDDFNRSNIVVIFHDYIHPVYAQLDHPFLGNMSAVDAIFNHGKEAIKIVKEGFKL